MDSSSRFHHHHHQQQQQQQQQLNSSPSSSGLLRFRSAPASVIEQLQVEGSCSSQQAERSSFLRFLNSNNNGSGDGASASFRDFQDNNNKPPPPPPPHHHHNHSTSSADLPRQSSFPPPHFSFHNKHGYDSNTNTTMMKGIENYSSSKQAGELSLSTMNNQISFSSSRSPSSSSAAIHNNNGGLFPNYDFWNEISCKRDEPNRIIFDANHQNEEFGNNKVVVHTIRHQLSFPKAASEMFGMENMIHFPLSDSVPCKIRAKRGCATHPRSIAERVRRTRISERMRKLQELVPNMDKQASTADMLDMAVGYIKDLQKQFKKLSDRKAKCKCIRMKKLDSSKNS
ncbi:hypothetical protein PIB30_028838 [Stylosanthes scabra]|uniref:BHLH domain-containing protein n=1 Tax=Stylosanthes scabra TaxID=79078 RepID=A0ABU6UAA7_9FABA|nr:hypothetical protein [Stylosanthes scabra]